MRRPTGGQARTKAEPSRSGEAGGVNLHDFGPAPPLLVRRPPEAAQPLVTALLRDAGADSAETAGLLGQRSVLVLSDLTLPPSAPPMAAAAFRIDPESGVADLIAIAVQEPWRRRGLGRRLLSATLTLLRAEGVDRVRALARSGSPGALLLVSAGFAVSTYTSATGGWSQFQLLL